MKMMMTMRPAEVGRSCNQRLAQIPPYHPAVKINNDDDDDGDDDDDNDDEDDDYDKNTGAPPHTSHLSWRVCSSWLRPYSSLPLFMISHHHHDHGHDHHKHNHSSPSSSSSLLSSSSSSSRPPTPSPPMLPIQHKQSQQYTSERTHAPHDVGTLLLLCPTNIFLSCLTNMLSSCPKIYSYPV